MQSNSRRLTDLERKLIQFLISKANISLPINWESEILASPMEDGGMGSLYLFTQKTPEKKRVLGLTASEYQFKDKDGIDVIASLNLDTEGKLFELDIWKTDFSPLISLPEVYLPSS